MSAHEQSQAVPDSPARDARFRVVDTWQECANFPDGDPRKVLEFMHRQMNEEMDATECSARTLTDFPNAPWELRMFLARQCADEARKQGDHELADFLDAQFADEIMHVRCANEFLQDLIAKEPRLALKVASALTEATRAFAKVFGGEGTAVAKYTVSEQGRLEAGFRPEEVAISNRLAEQRRERAIT